MCFIDLEPCEVWNERRVRARKQHTCDCCGGLIRPGEDYMRHFSVFEGDPTTERACLPCEDVRAEFLRVHGTGGTPGSMRPLLDDCITAEEDDGHDEMAGRWRTALAAMDERRTQRGGGA